MPHDTTAILIASPWIVGTIAAIFIAVRAARQPVSPLPDPAFRDRGLREDREVAALDALWEMPTREPLR